MPGASRHSSRMKGRHSSQIVLLHLPRFSACLGKSTENFSVQVSINGFQPKCTGSRYTIPHRLTVAGEATDKSLTSNMTVMLGGSLMRSPLERQSILLSSSTVFMFSIQMASTGPSKFTHFLLSEESETASRTKRATKPSFHSPVFTLKQPYSSSAVMLLGLRKKIFVSWCAGSSEPFFFSCVKVLDKINESVDLPVIVRPTSITPCRTN
mmetsp:Transcript_162917/g.522390  ORF Transcript_162917/g.522390 Transcript_162917/m.522390 type:complete len:210 (+) Transcript_162917:614-1243(+)